MTLVSLALATAVAFDHSHAGWTAVLAGHVHDGAVDYTGLHQRGGPALDAYLRSLVALPRDDYQRFSREQRLAFWINAYNAYTIRVILDHHPVKSIRSIGFLPMAAFRRSFIPLLGGELSLNDIENDRLRKELREPRIHFAIVCASKSCPTLRAQAYRADQIEEQLEQAARAFVRDPRKNRWDGPGRTLFLSSIFKWFRGDFEQAAGSLEKFVARYLGPPIAEGSVKVEFLDYDWSLNGR